MMVFEYAPNGSLFEHLHGNTADLIEGLGSVYKKNAKFCVFVSFQLRKLNLLTGAQE